MRSVGNKDNFGVILTDLEMTSTGESREYLSETVREMKFRYDLPDGGLALPLNEKWKMGLSKCQLLNRVTMMNAGIASAMRVRKGIDGMWSDPVYPSDFCSVYSSTMPLAAACAAMLKDVIPNSGITMTFTPDFNQMEIVVPKDVELMLGENLVVAFGLIYSSPRPTKINGTDVYVYKSGKFRSVPGMCDVNLGLGGAQMGKIMVDIVENNKLVSGQWSQCLGYLMLHTTPFEQCYIDYVPDSIGHNFVELSSSHVYRINIRIVDENDSPVTVSVLNAMLPCLICQFEFKKGSYWSNW